MFNRLRKIEITPEMEKRKREAEELHEKARKELEEAHDLAESLRAIRLKNHFAEGFRRSLGGTGGT